MPFPHGVLDILYIAFLLLPIASIYITVVHFRWYGKWKPSPFIKHLVISSIAVDVSALLFAFVALSLYFEWFKDGSIFRTIALLFGIAIAIGVKFWRRYDLRRLDGGPIDHEDQMETQEQTEDREFGDKRRKLEKKHDADQRSEEGVARR